MRSLTYMPLLRGKENELRLLLVTSTLIQGSPVVPVIEPVSAKTAMLERVIKYYVEYKFPLGVIINPAVGDFSESPEHLLIRTGEQLCRTSWVFPVARSSFGGIAWNRLERAEKFALIDDGPPCHEIRANLMGSPERIAYRINDSEVAPGQGEHHLGTRILLRDGFERRRNADYPADEEFHSGPGHLDLRDASGWGDYLIVGREYQEGGGRPHAVAIHITYWASDGQLRVHHYLSDSNDGPENPAGKFAEALAKLVTDLDDGALPILETSAIRGFRKLHAIGHFPGLGPVKLLSMRHHLETVLNVVQKTTAHRNAASLP
ncbi:MULTISPECIES: sce7725 family protein [unclassified Wenzhouxiangella]|uniref:sce7725 family protein n=1 Tax=unclassified Wenzhouxiangella TaxID=2613841 RepID=UPI000E329DDB|nr:MULTISPECIES: sce7725 family protein [unclassified Wenzhouxiangella]RFF27210.1 ATP-binding protein [Wenzhouxiangella sp. 15181]RFP69104.1 ATP-binding protein [Wenzhouxiangella sp. 15190]